MSAALISVPFETKEQWHQIRRTGIGGSDTAALLGLSRWCTPLQLYHDKLGKGQPIEESEAMEWGNRLEPAIRQAYADRTGKAVLQPNGVLRREDAPFMLANLDGYTEDRRIVEIKTARMASDWGDEGTDEIPTDYFLQVQHYMAVTGFETADVAVLIGGQDFRIYEVDADPELHQMLFEQEAAFWERVQKEEPPAPINQADIIQFCKARNAAITATGEIEKTVNELKGIKETLKTLKDTEKELQEIVKSFLGEHDTLIDLEDNALVTWKATKAAELFDKERFQLEQKDLYTKYLKKGQPSRQFRLK